MKKETKPKQTNWKEYRKKKQRETRANKKKELFSEYKEYIGFF